MDTSTSMEAAAGSALRGIGTLGELFAWRVGRTPQALAYRQYDRAAGAWRGYSWSEIQLRVGCWQRALSAQTLGAGARVGVLLPNGVDAVCADQALQSLGLVAVPMHALDNPASIRYILDDCQVALLLVASPQQWQAIADCGPLPEHLRQVVTVQACDAGPAERRPAVVSLAAWLERPGEPGAIASRAAGADLAAIVHTSGTTGRPKGVMLSHANVLANLRGLMARVPLRADDVFLSVLPLSHTFERTVGYYLPLAAGASVAYARSMALLADDLAAIRPTVLVAVPRIDEKFHAALSARVAGAGAAICGGAPLPAATAQGLLAMGLPLLQGYGMTECAPVVATNGIDDNWPASVGRPLAGCEVRLGVRDEPQVRSASVMLGYWGRPEDSARVLGADGWFGTGDQAVVEQGRIRIVGRIKDILVTSTGEKIAAATVEQAILGDPLFAQAMVMGDNRPYLSAQLPHYGAPRAACALTEPWTVENSLLTPTLKLKREALMARYAVRIAAMYAARSSQPSPDLVH